MGDELDLGVQQLDAGTREPGLPDARQADALMVTIEGQRCDNPSPESLGLSRDIATRVSQVMSGDGCGPIRLSAPVPAGCTEQWGELSRSNFNFVGTVLVLDRGRKYDLQGEQGGNLFYKAVRSICNAYPEAAVSAVGIEMIPTGLDQSQIQAIIERGRSEEIAELVRFHIWKGSGEIVSVDGTQFLSLDEGMQVLMEPKSFKVIGSMEFR